MRWREMPDCLCLHIELPGTWPTDDEVRQVRALLRASGCRTGDRTVLLDFRQMDPAAALPSIEELAIRTREWVAELGAPARLAFLTSQEIDRAAQAYLAGARRGRLLSHVRSFTDEQRALEWLTATSRSCQPG